MDKFILKVMRHLDNPELFTKDEMWENANNAWAVADAADAAWVAYAAADAYYAAYATTSYATTSYAVSDANYWIDEYFKKTKENKQDYINEVERLR